MNAFTLIFAQEQLLLPPITPGHILCTCDAISLKKLLYLGKANTTPEEVVSVAP